MKKRQVLLAAVGLLTALLMHNSALAASENVCKFNGSWYGFLPTTQNDFVGTAHGSSPSGGTYVLEVPGLIPALFGFPDVVNWSSFRGTWNKIDKKSVAFTLVGYAVNASGGTEFIAKISGVDTFSEDCNLITINNSIEFFAPDQDPFGIDDPAYGWIIAAPHTASRIRVDPPRT